MAASIEARKAHAATRWTLLADRLTALRMGTLEHRVYVLAITDAVRAALAHLLEHNLLHP